MKLINSKSKSKEAILALKSLKKAVSEELLKKAKLGQYAIVDLGDGKPSRVLASELIDNFNKSQ